MNSENREKVVSVQNGWPYLAVGILMWISVPALVLSFIILNKEGLDPTPWRIIAGISLIPLSAIFCSGFFTLQPNEARVLILFGKYVGTVRKCGFHWGNPFYSNGNPVVQPANENPPSGAVHRPPQVLKATRNKISLRARNLNGERLKVNDNRGNPIEIAAVVVWRVRDTAQAMFDVDDYTNYVKVQYESALRGLAGRYAYDDSESNETTLRSGLEEVSHALTQELQERLSKAGVEVEEARIAHLAYSPEIAQTMLRRQQADAIIAARQKIVHGAVSMVEMALQQMEEKGVVELDNERKAAMVSNLLVVLCGESDVHPVVNVGTLHN